MNFKSLPREHSFFCKKTRFCLREENASEIAFVIFNCRRVWKKKVNATFYFISGLTYLK